MRSEERPDLGVRRGDGGAQKTLQLRRAERRRRRTHEQRTRTDSGRHVAQLEEPTLVVEKQRQKHSDLVEASLVHHRQEGPVEGTADGEADGGDDVGEERPLLLQLGSRTRISLGGVEAEIRKQNDVDSQDDSLQKRTV